MFRVIVNKLRYRKKKNSIVLSEIDIYSQILFYNIILSFRLIINLKMKRHKKLALNFQSVT